MGSIEVQMSANSRNSILSKSIQILNKECKNKRYFLSMEIKILIFLIKQKLSYKIRNIV